MNYIVKVAVQCIFPYSKIYLVFSITVVYIIRAHRCELKIDGPIQMGTCVTRPNTI